MTWMLTTQTLATRLACTSPTCRTLFGPDRARGTTVYLADGGRCDMLPALLSENVCSLLGGCERLAVSCVWTLDARFRPVNRTKGGRKPDENPWFGRTVIRSDHQLNYYQAQAILDGKPPPTDADDLRDDRETRRVRADLAVLAAFAARRNASRCVYFFIFVLAIRMTSIAFCSQVRARRRGTGVRGASLRDVERRSSS